MVLQIILSIVWSIANNSPGTLCIIDNPGRGTIRNYMELYTTLHYSLIYRYGAFR